MSGTIERDKPDLSQLGCCQDESALGGLLVTKKSLEPGH